MGEAAFDYGDLLDESAHSRRARIVWLALIGVLLAALSAGLWYEFFRGSSSATAAPQTATVDRGAITESVSTSGVVAAQQTSSLSFQQSGKVTAVNVALGQAVKQGDVLAEIDPADLQSAVDAANASLSSAQAKLNTLLAGSTASALASADQSVVQAQASYDKAVRALQTLQEPPAPADTAAAQQAVTSAQAAVVKAQQSRADLGTNSQDAIAKAQATADKAGTTLQNATTSRDAADATVSSAEATLFSAESAYCPDADVTFCASHAAPLSPSDENTLVTVTDSGAADRALLANKLLSANSGYAKALSDDRTAAAAAASAQSDLDDAQAALSKAQQGPTTADIATADAAVSGAQVALAAAQDKVNTLLAGPTQDQLDAAQSDIDTAGAGLRSAQAKRDETYQGSLPSDIQQQRQAVAQAQTAAAKAVKDLDKAKLIAPFDGTVAVLNLQVGDTAGAGGASSSAAGSGSSSAAVMLNTPNNIRLDLTVSETDLPNVKVGQTGLATFDAIPGRTFPIVIDSVGTNPTTTQGVVTYSVRAHFAARGPVAAGAVPPVAGAPAPSGDAAGAAALATETPAPPNAATTPGAGGRNRGARTPGAGGFTGGGAGTPGVDVPSAGAAGSAAGALGVQPAPGMNARITIIVDQRQNVLRLPVAAVQRSGRDSVVQVKQADGSTQTVTVQTGLSDGQHIEITGGVDEGATVSVPGVTAAASAVATTPRSGGVGGGGFGGFGGGGGGGGRGGGGG